MANPLLLTVAAALLLGASSSTALEGITITTVFGPETAGGRYKHPASITQLEDGGLYLAYYGGSGEYGVDTKVWGARLPEGAAAWQAPEVIADTPGRSEGNPVVWQEPGGRIWLFYVVRYGDTWSESRIKGKISSDGARTWSDSFMVTFEKGTMVRGKPLLLEGGDILLPIYHETGRDRENVGADTTSLFLRRDAETGDWSESNRITSRLGNLQPAAVQLGADHLLSFCRRGGGYGPATDTYIVRSESRDNGRTWTPGEDTPFPNPNAAVELIKLANGHLVLIYNNSMVDRTPLSVAISMDKGKTWPAKKDLFTGPGPFAYPYAIQTKDGKIHLIFTTRDRTLIKHAVFEEALILAGDNTPPL